MKIKYTIFFLFLFIAWSMSAQEQNNISSQIKVQLILGYNIGASAPLPLPEEVRKIKSYNPKFNPQLGFNVQYPLSDKWGLGTGLTIDWKGMRVKDEVKYMYTTVQTEGSDGKLTGYFVGDNMTNTDLVYLTLPVYATYEINPKWQVRLGMYVSKALSSKFDGNVSNGYIRIDTPTGQKQEISEATFDFSDKIRDYDLGILGGANFNLDKRFSIYGNLAWGLLPFFYTDSNPIQFDLHNIFGTIGLSYKIK